MSVTRTIDQRKNWWKVFVIIFAVSVSVVGYIGVKTYQYAPPIADFVGEDGKMIFAAEDITAGQKVFFSYGLMEYGSFLVQKEIKKNRYDAEYYTKRGQTKEHRYQPGAVVASAAQAQAFRQLNDYYRQMFGEGGKLAGQEEFKPANYIADPEKVRQLSAFFYWGGWLCGAERPGYLTWLRGLGTAVFVLGGVFPLAWFMVSRWFQLKPAQTTDEQFVVPRSVLAVAEPIINRPFDPIRTPSPTPSGRGGRRPPSYQIAFRGGMSTPPALAPCWPRTRALFACAAALRATSGRSGRVRARARIQRDHRVASS